MRPARRDRRRRREPDHASASAPSPPREAPARAAAEGRLAWHDPLPVPADVRGLPSGERQNAPPGTVVGVRDTAEKMIAISDNTATDMLIQAVGREAVEAALVD
ncbi:serine hydrolase, partial [Clavibacter michiganensis]|uniref:serine hydrolase n=1 Tax=Clavibacter michiganensis TaxID=28447 RepID=UPI002931906E